MPGRLATLMAAGAVFIVAAVGCGGAEPVEDASEAVASILASGDCLTLMDISASVQRVLGGAVGTEAAQHSQFLADFATRAPREIGADIAVVRQAYDVLMRGQDGAALDQAAVRRSAENLAAWARGSCPG